jgi:hypothetical protein
MLVVTTVVALNGDLSFYMAGAPEEDDREKKRLGTQNGKPVYEGARLGPREIYPIRPDSDRSHGCQCCAYVV